MVTKTPVVKVQDGCTIIECVATLARHDFVLCQAPQDSVRYVWTPSATGAPVVQYVLRVEQMGATPQMLTTLYLGADISTVRISVAGVDSLGRQGVWSEWSNE